MMPGVPQAFEIPQEAEVEASPEQVWEAIGTGPGWDSWFMGRNEIEPREGGTTKWSIGGFTMDSDVTAWDPPRRFTSKGAPMPDGSWHQFDYRLEDRGGGRTKIRYVHSGMLGGDWEAEYEAMSEGDPMYFQKLVEYVTFFSGRFATPIDSQGPAVDDREQAMSEFRRALGIHGEVKEGDPVRLTPEGFPPIDGVVDCVSRSFLGVRSDDALYRFIWGFTGNVMVGHHLFAEGVDQRKAEHAWTDWLTRAFAPAGGDGGASG
jgi:uncharacterized protein YndB with AHSA1/START domain